MLLRQIPQGQIRDVNAKVSARAGARRDVVYVHALPRTRQQIRSIEGTSSCCVKHTRAA
jgi:hypothetical protein